MARNINLSTLAVIIPMYNEELGVEKCVERVAKVIRKLDWQATLIAVDDGSTDATPHLLAQLQSKAITPMEVVTHSQNRGYGAALTTGIAAAAKMKLEWCLFMDSDLTNPPEQIAEFIETVKINPDLDCVKASRYMPGGQMAGVPFKRRIISQLGNTVARVGFRMGLRDCTNGFRMVRTKLLTQVPYQQSGFAIILEELYYLKKQGARCTQIPSRLTSRTATKTHFRYTLMTFWSYFHYVLKAALVPYSARSETHVSIS